MRAILNATSITRRFARKILSADLNDEGVIFYIEEEIRGEKFQSTFRMTWHEWEHFQMVVNTRKAELT